MVSVYVLLPARCATMQQLTVEHTTWFAGQAVEELLCTFAEGLCNHPLQFCQQKSKSVMGLRVLLHRSRFNQLTADWHGCISFRARIHRKQ